uniref:hypothetical protein n=1 Tax=Alloprevotella sp. TaxID=1872471 RepID=UPI004028CDD6
NTRGLHITLAIPNSFFRETLVFYVSAMFHQCFIFENTKHNGSAFTLPLCFCFSPIGFLNRSHSVFVFLPLGFYFFIGQYKDETLKLKVKHSLVMFHSTNILIANAFSTENET